MKSVLSAMALALIVSPSPLSAQSLEPLAKMIAEGAASDYPLVRCAALYRVMGSWSYERMTSEQIENVQDMVVLFLAAAANARARASGQSVTAAISEGVVRDKANIEDLYRQRFDDNYARTGQAWANDSVISSDTELCKGFMDAVRSETDQR